LTLSFAGIKLLVVMGFKRGFFEGSGFLACRFISISTRIFCFGSTLFLVVLFSISPPWRSVGSTVSVLSVFFLTLIHEAAAFVDLLA